MTHPVALTDTAKPEVLALTHLSTGFGKKQVLNDVSFSLVAGEVVAILGPNGAGKTTLISTILGLVKANSGTVSLFGQVQQQLVRSVVMRQQLGVMMQVGQLSANLTVNEQIDLFASYYRTAKSHSDILQLSGLAHCANHRFGQLSGGQKQRLLFALALAGKPQLVFLDEPTLGMDIEARQALWQQVNQLRAKGVSVVLTTHYLEEAEQLADRIIVLNQGRIIADATPAQLTALSSCKVIHCRSSLTPSQLTALPAVQQLSVVDGKATLHSSHVEQTLRQLLTQDAQLTQLEVLPVTLEQAFLQLTRDDNQNQERAA